MTNFTPFYTPSLLNSSKPFLNPFNFHTFSCSFFHHTIRCMRPCIKFKRKPFKLCCSSSYMSDFSNVDSSKNSDIWEDTDCVEVIGIGSRVDAVLDFCQQSFSSSQSFRFWNITRREPSRRQLHQRFLEKDTYPNIVETPLNPQSQSKAVVLVASAGYGDDYVIATDILRTIRSSSGLVVAVILRPFSFEGQRRQDEVNMLVDRLNDCVSFRIDIDIDTLLKMDLVTLDEALKTAYRAVSSAITAVSILVSDTHQKHIHSQRGSMKQITVAELIKVFECYKEGRVGFGVGNNVEASIVKAVFDCPFFSMGLKDLNGVVICVLSSSSKIEDNDVCTFLQTFREATECTEEVILSIVQNPDMKPNLMATTVITVGTAEGKSLQRSSILSRLADSIPFVFNFLQRPNMPSNSSKESTLIKNTYPPILTNSQDKNKVPDMAASEDTTEKFGTSSGKKMPVNGQRDEKECDDGEIDRLRRLDAARSSSKYIESSSLGAQAAEEKPHIKRNLGPGYRIAQEWHEEELNVTEAGSVADNPRVFQLPVGVRLSDDVQLTFDSSNSRRPVEKITDEDLKEDESAIPSVSSFNGLTDSFEVVTDFWNSATTSLKRKQLDVSKKQGVLSSRAASMLEAERDSKTRWSPVMEIRYRGGIFKGRCQGGLPEGRGRLTFLDGSVYDGMWRYGKRSGLGSLFFSNGDVFHGSWRDDLMHGKGWVYFHTGERWFANFWKGKANGEGRFYSKAGEVFFGHFQDGWRDGRFLCVKVDGTRYLEIWSDGVLVKCEELDA